MGVLLTWVVQVEAVRLSGYMSRCLMLMCKAHYLLPLEKEGRFVRLQQYLQHCSRFGLCVSLPVFFSIPLLFSFVLLRAFAFQVSSFLLASFSLTPLSILRQSAYQELFD